MSAIVRWGSVLSFVLSAAAARGAEPPSPPPAEEGPEARIARAVQRELEKGLFPGAVVLVGTGEKVLYHEAFGLAQLTPERAAMRKDSVFDVASVTKVVCTATAVGICRDRGLLDPDQPLTRYLPDHTGRGVEKISLRRLAAHTSGFPDSPRVSHGGKVTGDAVFEQLLREDPLWPVDTRYQYACRNIILLSTMVERVTKRSFGEFCQEEIFDPLAMKDSAFNRVEPSPRVVATHHPVLGENHNADGRDAGRAIGNAGLFTTAEDLSHFCEMLLNRGQWRGRRILSADTIDDFTKPNQPKQFPGRGFIWETDLNSTHRPGRMSPAAYGHSGNTGISLWVDPRLGVYTLVLTNRTHPTRAGRNTALGIDQYRARGRIADAALAALGWE